MIILFHRAVDFVFEHDTSRSLEANAYSYLQTYLNKSIFQYIFRFWVFCIWILF